MALRIPFFAAALAACAWAQPLRVYSEFQRVDPFCAVLASDKADHPREILSPALARGAYATYQVVISAPAGGGYSVFVAQNPENAIRVAAYRPAWIKRGDAWIPDGLEPLTIRETGEVVDDPASRVPGQTCRAIWLDLWVPRDAPMRRTRLEVQLNTGSQWVIYPMELRISSAVVPAQQAVPFEPLAPAEAPASETAARVLRGYVCGTPGGNGDEGPMTVRRLIRRNARQDVALARTLEQNGGKPALTAELLRAVGATDRAKWCESPSGPEQMGAEWYLRIRDYLLRSNPMKPAGLVKPVIAVKPIH